MTLWELLKKNYKPTNNLSLSAKIKEIVFYKENPNVFAFMVYGQQSYSNPNGHLVSILFEPVGKKSTQMLKTPCRVNCTCPAYTYWGSEFNATEQDYNYETEQFIEPNIRDPKREHLICKHIAATRKEIKNLTLNRGRKKFKTASDIVVYDSDGILSIPKNQIHFTHPDVQRAIQAKYGVTAETNSEFERVLLDHLY